MGPRQSETRQTDTRQTDARQSETRQTGMTPPYSNGCVSDFVCDFEHCNQRFEHPVALLPEVILLCGIVMPEYFVGRRISQISVKLIKIASRVGVT